MAYAERSGGRKRAEAIRRHRQEAAWAARTPESYRKSRGHRWSAWRTLGNGDHERRCFTAGCDAVEVRHASP
jgi:hypothetical protein